MLHVTMTFLTWLGNPLTLIVPKMFSDCYLWDLYEYIIIRTIEFFHGDLKDMVTISPSPTQAFLSISRRLGLRKLNRTTLLPNVNEASYIHACNKLCFHPPE